MFKRVLKETMSTKKLSARTQRRIRLNLAKQQSLALGTQDLNDPGNSPKRLRTTAGFEQQQTDQDCTAEKDLSAANPDDVLQFSHSDSEETRELSSLDSSAESDGTLGGSSVASSTDPLLDPELDLSSDLESSRSSDSSSEFDLHSDESDSSSPSGDSCVPVQYPGFQSPPLYAGSSISAHQFHVATASIALRHNLTYACQTDILRFISALLPSPNRVTTTAKSLTRKFLRYEQMTVVHRCCGVCMRLLPEGAQCLRTECVQQRVQDALFVEIPLDKQLQERFKGEL